ncbi:hypothetical protein [Actinomyces vulturis]|uniref:hypothetical protein n=1 Tax=Actinomyces vulturis TaxID=1857645 RepID=UPI000830D8F9|nr:hypothetical protein [Actinomyces vulturis]
MFDEKFLAQGAVFYAKKHGDYGDVNSQWVFNNAKWHVEEFLRNEHYRQEFLFSINNLSDVEDLAQIFHAQWLRDYRYYLADEHGYFELDTELEKRVAEHVCDNMQLNKRMTLSCQTLGISMDELKQAINSNPIFDYHEISDTTLEVFEDEV